jgi:cell wall-associated NlpC family hydrolase
MNLKNYLCVSFCLALVSLLTAAGADAQTRSRIVTTGSSRPINTAPANPIKRTILSSPTNAPVSQPLASQTTPTKNPNQRPVLTNQIAVPVQNAQPLVKKIVSSQPVATAAPKLADANNTTLATRFLYSTSLDKNLMRGIEAKFGIPYLMGSQGPNRYDCSGFVWSVFTEAGIFFERSSARTYWNEFEPVSGDARFKFGTLVFFNKLGHVGIVADENGFYHASSSKGITYSPFKGYWEKRIVGFRRIPTM